MISNAFFRMASVGQVAAIIVFGTAAAAGVAASALALGGIFPWPEVSMSFAGEPVAWAGMALQLAVSAFLVLIALFLPSAWRVQKLEASHRQFEMNMDDVTRAYRAAHMADRAEMFEMRREFDSIRERYQFLKSHPDLAEMDADLLTIAAQMSEQSRELAEMYSDEKVARARESLKQRRVDAETLADRIQSAHADLRDLRRMMDDVDIEESAVTSQLLQLREAVTEIGIFNGPEFVANRGGAPHLKTVSSD